MRDLLAEAIREGYIENSTLIFNVEVRDGPEHQVNFTLSVSDDSMVGTVCPFTCGTVRLKRSNRWSHNRCDGVHTERICRPVRASRGVPATADAGH
jgi:hypothetical protein